MQRGYETWESAELGRSMELLWFGHAGYPVLMFPTSCGRFYQYEDTGLVGALAEKIDAGHLQLVCVDSVDAESWYANGKPPVERGARQDAYDAYLATEIAPYLRHRGGTDAFGVFGCSFGSYHAANFAMRHPETVSKAVCLSGIFDVARFTDGYWDARDRANSPVFAIDDLAGETLGRVRAIDWTIAAGELDSLAHDNVRFDQVLTARGVPHRFEYWRGVSGHDWPDWIAAAARLL